MVGHLHLVFLNTLDLVDVVCKLREISVVFQCGYIDLVFSKFLVCMSCRVRPKPPDQGPTQVTGS